MQQALQYQSGLGWAAAAYGAETGQSGAYYGGLAQYVAAQQEMMGPAAKRGARVPGLSPGQVLAPWQFPNAQQAMALGVTVYVQMPNGQYVPALVRSMHAMGADLRLQEAHWRDTAYGLGG